MSRPERPISEYPGHHYEAVAASSFWITPAIGAGRCRTLLYGKKACGKRAAATLMRSSVTGPRPWDYCERHLYGQWIENGQVMRWKLVKDEAAAEGDA